jgi:hypothetical protein
LPRTSEARAPFLMVVVVMLSERTETNAIPTSTHTVRIYGILDITFVLQGTQ